LKKWQTAENAGQYICAYLKYGCRLS